MFEEPYVTDALNGAIPAFAGYTAWLLWRACRPGRGAAFYGFSAMGLAWLAFDEWIGLHEWVGRQLLPDFDFVNHPDDVIMMAYVAVAASVAALCWRELAGHRRMAVVLVAAIGFTAIAAGVDGFGRDGHWLAGWLEEIAELTAAGCALLAFRNRLTTSTATGITPEGALPGSPLRPQVPSA